MALENGNKFVLVLPFISTPLDSFMKSTYKSVILFALILGWLSASQVIVLSHDATHAFHTESSICDDFRLASCNNLAATQYVNTEFSVGYPDSFIQSPTRQTVYAYYHSFQARAPPVTA